MKTSMFTFLIAFLSLLSCQKADLVISDQNNHSPLKYPVREDSIHPGDWMLIQGYLNSAECIVHLFASPDAFGYWQTDSIGTYFPLPGPTDFEFAYNSGSSRFSIRSPFEFHHEDFSIWDESGFCAELADLSNFQINKELNYWVLDATLGTEFTSCIETTSKRFDFRFSFFQ